MRLRTPAVFVSLIALIAGVVFSLGGVTPAFANAVSLDSGGLLFSADSSSPADGATVTGPDATTASTDITIPSSVTIDGTDYAVVAVAASAFEGSNLTSVTIPGSVTSIGDNAFNGPDLTTVIFDGAPPTTIDDQTDGSPFGDGSASSGDLPTIDYDAAFGGPGGFTSPDWEGYPTQATATVDYELDGHGSTIAPSIVDVGDTPTPPADPYVPGYQFEGWYRDPGLTTAVDFNSAINSDSTWYARWTATSTTSTLPSDDALYAISCGGEEPTGQLLQVNAVTDEATSIGSGSALGDCGYDAVWDAATSTAYFENYELDNSPIETMNLKSGVSSAGFQPIYDGAPINFLNLAMTVNGVLYGTDQAQDPTLYAVDTATHAATLVHTFTGLNLEVIGAAGPKSDDLYGISNDGETLSLVDPTTKTATTLTDNLGLNRGANFALENLEVDSSGVIWVQTDDGDDAQAGTSSEVWTIDPSDGYKLTAHPTLTVGGTTLDVESLLIVPRSAVDGAGHLAVTGVSINPLAIPTALSVLAIGAVLVVVVGRIRTRARRRAKARSVAE